MGIANETTTSGLQAALASGVASISQNQTVTFTQYTKTVLAEDGFVFWVKTATSEAFTGSLHYITHTEQVEDETIGINSVVFTATQEVTVFNTINPQTLWIGDFQVSGGGSIQIAFSDRNAFYQQANLWHYRGFAVYPALQAQLVASAADLPAEPIVSNSLPIWLSQNSIAPVYPSFLVPDNIVPPYIVAHVEPRGTVPLGNFPIYQWPGNPVPPTALQQMASSQLMQDDVRLTLYGLNNQQAIQYLVSLIQYSISNDPNGGTFGFCNSPAIMDEKRTQSEITSIAMKKTINILASYYLGTADALARRLILSASVTTTT